MPRHNAFRHQEYKHNPLRPGVARTAAVDPPAPDSAEWLEERDRSAARLAHASLARVILVHGTFAGDDILGFFRKLSHLVPSAAARLRALQKTLVDGFLGQGGNFHAAYAAQFQGGLRANGIAVPVTSFHWSGENHHVARAEAALRLIVALSRIQEDGRILIWAHSHGGNVLALVSNLLQARPATRRTFLHTLGPYLRGLPLDPGETTPLLERALAVLEQPWAWDRHPLDFVTFGTPVRYGWDTGGYSRLLHFLHHRPVDERSWHEATFPPRAEDLREAAHGDYVQQLGIAGTNLIPSVLSWRTRRAEHSLARILERGLPPQTLLERLRAGVRVPDEGDTLLVDYRQADGLHRTMAGHAVYTHLEWLPFHLREVARHLYDAPTPDPQAKTP